MHNIYNRNNADEILDHSDKIAAVCYRSDGKQIAVSTTRGEVYLWHVEEGQIQGMLDVNKDLKGGRGEKDFQDAKNQFNQKFLKTMSYTVDGEWLVGAGVSKNVCIYDLKHRVMVKKLILSSNRSLDGVEQLLNSKNIKDGLNMKDIDDASEESDVSKDLDDDILPGAKRPNYMKRNTKLRIEAKMLRIEPGGRSLAVATSEGFMIFGVEDYLKSSLANFSIAGSKDDLLNMIKSKNYPGVIASALSIKDERMLKIFITKIPCSYIDIICKNLPGELIGTFMAFLAKEIEESKHVELVMLWLRAVILFNQKSHFENIDMGLLATLRTGIKAMRHRIAKIVDMA